jgi:hypothetical protein
MYKHISKFLKFCFEKAHEKKITRLIISYLKKRKNSKLNFSGKDFCCEQRCG